MAIVVVPKKGKSITRSTVGIGIRTRACALVSALNVRILVGLFSVTLRTRNRASDEAKFRTGKLVVSAIGMGGSGGWKIVKALVVGRYR